MRAGCDERGRRGGRGEAIHVDFKYTVSLKGESLKNDFP